MRASTSVFTVRDILASSAYYRDKPGFQIAIQYGNPTFYTGVCEGEVSAHLRTADRFKHCQPGSGAVSIFVDDVDVLHTELRKRGANVTKAPVEHDNGLHDFEVIDLDVNMIYFGMESRKD